MVMGANLIPRDDQSEFQISIRAPEGYTLERTNNVVTEIEHRVSALPGVVKRFVSIGQRLGRGQGDVTRASIYLGIKDLNTRQYSQFDVMECARGILKDYPDMRTAVSDISTIGGGSDGDSRPFRLYLMGPELDKLAGYADELKDKLRREKGLADVDTNLSLRKPELQVEIDRERASDLGVPVQIIASGLQTLVGGQIVSSYKEGTEQYDVWLRADKQFRTHPDSLKLLSVPSPQAGLVQLDSLTRINERQGPSQIYRVDRQRTVSVAANLDGSTINEAVNRTKELLAGMNLPAEYQVKFTGQAETLGEAAYYFVIALVLSLILMYLILAAQFESWMNPIAILSALPVTVPFAVASLLLFRQPFDLYAMFGLFMLIGIVKKNGILQIDKTNELRRAGLPRLEAVLDANHTRLRPILMTTVMLIAAMIPIALGQGPGAGARASMAKVIIGGQMLSLLLALLVTPVTYVLFDRFTRMGREERKKKALAAEE